jgi:hypothetical protein
LIEKCPESVADAPLILPRSNGLDSGPKLNENMEMINLKKVEVFERVRDLKFHNNKLYLFLEKSSSIGIINLI